MTLTITDADLVRLARELIAKIRANGHDVTVYGGKTGFPLNVREPNAEPPLVREKGFISFALGVDMTPYVAIFASPDCDRIFAAALQTDT